MVEISVIIPAIGDITPECEEIFEESEYDDYEIIIEGGLDGPSKARNLAFEKAKGDKIVFLDDDSVPKENYLENVSKALDEHYLIQGRVIHPQEDIFREIASHYDQGDSVKETEIFISCNMACRREVFEEINGFDEDLPYGHEDPDFGLRALESGFKAFYRPEVEVKHSYVDTYNRYLKKEYRHGNEDIKFWRKHPKKFNLESIIPYAHEETLKTSLVASLGILIRDLGRIRGLFRR